MRRYLFLLTIFLVLFARHAFGAFVVNGNGTVTDTSTGLMWQQTTAGGMTWEAAISYCEGRSLGGYSDWRLPNRNELQSLVDYTRYNPSIDTAAFPGTMSSYYWSSTTYALSTGYAWSVYFGSGGVDDGVKSGTYYVRAVRGGQSGPLDDLVTLIISVYNSSTGYAIEAAQVTVGDTTKETDQSGLATFPDLPLGEYGITIEAAGYITYNTNVDLTEAGTVNLSYSLQPLSCPVISGHTPTHSASDIPTSTTITVIFSRSMNRPATQAAFNVIPATSGSFTWSNNDQTLTFTPTNNNLYPNQQYKITVTGSARDTSGNSLDSNRNGTCGETDDIYSFTFTTQDDTSLYLDGYITDADTGGALEQVLVELNTSQQQTNIQGYYKFSSLTKGTVYSLKAGKEGYCDYTESITMDNTTHKVVNIKLKLKNIQAPTITRIEPDYEGIFIQGVSVDNTYKVGVDWGGEPGEVKFILNGNEIIA